MSFLVALCSASHSGVHKLLHFECFVPQKSPDHWLCWLGLIGVASEGHQFA